MTESFERIIERLIGNARDEICEVAPQYWTDTAYRLKDAHEHELEQAKKSEYDRGYQDGLHARDTAIRREPTGSGERGRRMTPMDCQINT